MADILAARAWRPRDHRRLRPRRHARDRRCRAEPQGPRPRLRHASAFRPCAGAWALAAHRLDGRAGNAGSSPWPGRDARILAAFPAVHGIRHRHPYRRRGPARSARSRFDFGIFGRAGARRGWPRRDARCASSIRPWPSVMPCASSMADAASYSRPTRPIFRRSPHFARGADILVHEAMLEDGIERLVARTGNGARLKQHLLASHTMAERCRPHRCRGRGRASRDQSSDTRRRS